MARAPFPAVAPEQLPYVFSGKYYLLARLLFQLVLLVAFAIRVASGSPVATPPAAVGALLTIGGFFFRRWARKVLGERFRGFEVRREERGLERRGPYALVRHPGYLGLMLMDVGLPLMLNLPPGLLLSAMLVALVVRRIAIEDRLLAETYADYASYASSHRRLIPGIW
jgi:protein-S-isoprenylcysteine O-methyltransferase Ste14